MVLISILTTLIYLILIGGFVLGFDKISTFKLENKPSKTTFSIVIPFRNEAKNLPVLLNSVSSLSYPKHMFEIIFIDDASEDNSVEIIKNHIAKHSNISILINERHSNSPKKDAITTAVKHAKNEWIVTTDADCQLPKLWLNSYDEFIQKTNAVCVAAPVTYKPEPNFCNTFQLLDMLSLQGATIGGFGIKKPFLCNGANFAYTKQLFFDLHGFDGNTNTASGDDVFFLEKALKIKPKQTHYLKCEDTIVITKAQPNWSDLIAQRMRWAAKTSAYQSWFSKLTGVTVLLMNTLVICLTLLAFIGAFKTKTLLYILIIKFNIDWYLIYKSALFFNQRRVLKFYAFGFLVYPFFSVYVAILSMFFGYKWKGRHFRK